MLIKLTLEEIKKSHQSKMIYYVFILISLAIILPGMFLYFEKLPESIIFYTYNVFTSNMQFLYPIIFIFSYSWSVGHEYSLRTYEILKNSALNFEYFILSKFIAWTLILSTFYSLTNVIYLIFLIYTNDLSNIYLSQLHISSNEFIIRWLIVNLLSLIFLISIGSMAMFVTFFTKKWVFTLILIMTSIIFIPNLPAIDIIQQYSPIGGFQIPQFFYMYIIDINLVFKTLLINIIYIFLFMILFIYLSKKSEIYKLRSNLLRERP